jgi:hypothetical protein
LSPDWPFLAAMPPERVELQRQLVDGDPFLGQLGVRFCDATSDAATLADEAGAVVAQGWGVFAVTGSRRRRIGP